MFDIPVPIPGGVGGDYLRSVRPDYVTLFDLPRYTLVVFPMLLIPC